MKITIETFGPQADPILNVEGIKLLSKSESREIEKVLRDFLEKYTDKSPLSL
jgi:hypothetical protein